ncbi:neurofilament heavy polypeptide-like isoform x5, partial [Plakobranchus ocellatus]
PSAPLQPSTKLPLISSATPHDNRLVPVRPSNNVTKDFLRASAAGNFYDFGGPGGEGGGGRDHRDEERMHILETRLGVTEKSNRALLEEVIRLQGELRLMVRRNEEGIKDERVSRQHIEGSLHMVNDLISKLSSRIKMAEDKIMEERSALSTLVSHTRGVEQAVVASQNSLSMKKDSQTSKLQDLSLQLSEMQHSRDSLEKQTFNLTEELRAVKTKVESQSIELTSTINDLKLRSRRLEEENKMQLDALRKQGDMYSTTETTTTHLRGQVESRLAELRDVIMELRKKQEHESTEIRTLEQGMQQQVNSLQQTIAEQNRKREESLHALDMMHREKEHAAENEKLRLQGRMSETVEEVNKRMLAKEIKLREELQEKYSQLERIIQQEQQMRQKYEAALREENDRRWQGLKKLSDDEMATIKDTFQAERQKNKEAVSKLDESITLLEKQLAEQKRQTDKVVAAEIKSRKQYEKSTNEKIAHVNDKIALATSSLQSAIGGVQGTFANHTDKIRTEVKSMVTASEQANTRAMTDLDAKLQSVKKKVADLEEQLEGRISEATAILAQNLREKVESISLWQDVTSQTIRELNQSIQGIPNELYALEEKQKLLKHELDSRMSSETDSRIRDVETLKHEVEMLKNKKQPQVASLEEMQEVQASVRKLAESVQTVKTVIGMKIQSEQKLRVAGIDDLQTQVNRLKSQASMHPSLLHSSLLMRPDTDQALLDDFLTQHDVTRDIIPPQFAHAQNRADNISVNSGAYKPLPATHVDPDAEPVPGGYAARYSKGKTQSKPLGGPHNSADADRASVNTTRARQPQQQLDTVSEGENAEADWDLLSSVAYGSYDDQHGKQEDEKKKDEKKEDREVAADLQTNPDWGDGERGDGVPHSPLDRATEASLKGAHPTLSDIVGSRNAGTETPGMRSTVMSRPVSKSLSLSERPAEKESGGANSPLKATPVAPAAATPKSPKKTRSQTNTPEQLTPKVSAKSRQGSRGDPLPYDELDMIVVDDKDEIDKKSEPMNNTLEWQPATPTGQENQSRFTPGASKKTRSPQPFNNKLNWEQATPEPQDFQTQESTQDRNERERESSKASLSKRKSAEKGKTPKGKSPEVDSRNEIVEPGDEKQTNMETDGHWGQSTEPEAMGPVEEVPDFTRTHREKSLHDMLAAV